MNLRRKIFFHRAYPPLLLIQKQRSTFRVFPKWSFQNQSSPSLPCFCRGQRCCPHDCPACTHTKVSAYLVKHRWKLQIKPLSWQVTSYSILQGLQYTVLVTSKTKTISPEEHLKFPLFHFIGSRWYGHGWLRQPAATQPWPVPPVHTIRTEQHTYQIKACVWWVMLACSWLLGLLGRLSCRAHWKHEVWHYLTKSKGVNKVCIFFYP